MTYYSYQKFLLHLCNLHNEVFGGPQARINTECFLPTREGVSPSIATANAQALVSSLHGRVYRSFRAHVEHNNVFPPYTGGCIATAHICTNIWHRFLPTREGVSVQTVGSLHGRAYRLRDRGKRMHLSFPPYTGECIVNKILEVLNLC